MAADDVPVGQLAGEFGPNVGLVEEVYRQWVDDPCSVAESWQDFFADYTPRLPSDGRGNGVVTESPAVSEAPAQAVSPAPAPARAPAPPPAPEGPAPTPIRGTGAAIVRNMEASLGAPTHCSSRTSRAPTRSISTASSPATRTASAGCGGARCRPTSSPAQPSR